jgi:hypothetical protein
MSKQQSPCLPQNPYEQRGIDARQESDVGKLCQLTATKFWLKLALDWTVAGKPCKSFFVFCLLINALIMMSI